MSGASALPSLQAILRAQSHADQLSAIAEQSDTDCGSDASAGQVPTGHLYDHAVPGLHLTAEAEQQQLQDQQHGAADPAAAVGEQQQPHSLSPDASSAVSGEAGPVEASQQHLSAGRVQGPEGGASPAHQGPSAALHLTERQPRLGSPLARGSSWVPQGMMQPLTPNSSGTVTPAAEGPAAQAGGGDPAAPAAGAMSRLAPSTSCAPGELQATLGCFSTPQACFPLQLLLFAMPCRVAQGRLLSHWAARRGQQHGGGTCSVGQQVCPAQT